MTALECLAAFTGWHLAGAGAIGACLGGASALAIVAVRRALREDRP